ncbi:MAG: cell division protein FtsH [Acidobacteria bacterium]|nr:MAG: cell division protein FtsH [Acidobacteriota bacterium]
MASVAKRTTLPLAEVRLKTHFKDQQLHDLVTSSRTFPVTARVDVQVALERLFSGYPEAELLGLHNQYGHETLTIAHVLSNSHDPVVISPLQHEEVDIGEILPAQCLRKGLWLAHDNGMPFGLLLSAAVHFTQVNGVHIEVIVPPGEPGAKFCRALFEELETLIRGTASYRGKVLSLEPADRYSGHVGALRVHKLRSVAREQVILPERTLQLLDRNVGDFIKQREQLKKLGLPVKKGILFYGAPGTGKTHTIQYLASHLPDHTTLLVTSEQVAYLDHYFQLARFLQPAMLIIEDVDLIARAREQMRGACEESLLNKLLNEMDGLREDAAVLFVLTTNHPELLEAALASRPGRIDQAIEFPLPDERGRRQLVRLYACGLPLDDEVVESTVRRTERGSGAFIKELMRRAAQFYIQNGSDGKLTSDHVNSALEEMLFAGGSLNAKLLGAEGVAARETIH